MCESCSSKINQPYKNNSMKKFNLKGMTSNVVPILETVVGFKSAQVFNKLISTAAAADATKAEQNKMIVGGAQLLTGLLLSTMKNTHLRNVGLGIAVAGANSFVGQYVDQALTAAGVNAPGSLFVYPYRDINRHAMNGSSAIGCNVNEWKK